MFYGVVVSIFCVREKKKKMLLRALCVCGKEGENRGDLRGGFYIYVYISNALVVFVGRSIAGERKVGGRW